MYKQDLDRHLQNATVPRAMALFGENHFFIDRYAHRLSQIEGASVLNLYHDEYDFNSAKAHLSQGSLFGDQNLLIVKHEKKLPKAELDTLVELVGKNDDNYFIYCYVGEDIKSVDTAFKGSHAGSVRFYNPSAGEAGVIVVQEARQSGLQLDQRTAMHLLEVHNNDLSLACNELSKLSILNKPITIHDIDENVYGLSELKLDSFHIKIIEKKEFLNDLKILLETGLDEVFIITSLCKMLTELYLFNTVIKVNGFADPIAVLGYKPPPKIVEERTKLSIKILPEGYKRGINLLLDTELKMKATGSPDPEALLLSALLKLQSIL